MKIRKIIDICKKKGNIIIFESGKEQWISDGAAVFPMFNLPQFDEDSLCRTYDITDKQAAKIHFRHEYTMPTAYDFEDCTDDENVVTRGPMCLSDAGRGIIPYMTSQGVAFIDAKYLQPLSDIEDSMLNLYERHTKSGQIYFAAKSGFMLVGIILPVDAINDQFVERLKQLTQQCEIALFNKKSAAKREAEAAVQQSVFGTEDKT